MRILFGFIAGGGLLALAVFVWAAVRTPFGLDDLGSVSDGWRAAQRGRNLPD